ncbi:hypothetical protein ABPG74_006778 [Tetrahymena malaccensis]
MRFRKQKCKKDAEKEHQNLHTSKIKTFVDQKTLLLAKEVDSYAVQQSLLPDESIKIFQFYPKIPTPENDSSQKTNERKKSKKKLQEEKEVESKIEFIKHQIGIFEYLKSYVQKKLFISEEDSPQDQPETSLDEIFETRKKLLNDKFKDINNIFNLNYLPNIIQQNLPTRYYDAHSDSTSRQSLGSSSNISSRSNSRSRSRSVQREEIEQIQSKNQKQTYIQYEWFLIEEDQLEGFQGIQQYSFRSNQRFKDYYFNKSIQMEFNPQTTTIESFYQYTDFVQTSLLDNRSPISVTLNLQLDQPLSLLAILNILLTIKPFNILKINVSGQQKKNYDNKLLEMILKIAICQRSLQQISINIQSVLSLQDFALTLSSAMSSCDLEKSQVRVFDLQMNYYDDNPNLENNNNLSELFYQISRFNMLYHLSATKLHITQYNVENFNKILKLVTSAELLQMKTEFQLSSPNLTYLNLQYNFRSSKEEHVKYDYLKDLPNLQELELKYSTQITYIEITSRKEILKLSKKKLDEQDQDNKNDSLSQQDESQSQLFQFDNLVRLSQLQILNLQLKGQQNIIDSFIEFVRQSQFLREVRLKLQVEVNFEENEYLQYEIASSDLKLFSHLIQLKELEIFEVNQFFNQYLIISLSSFIEYSQSLKVLKISRNFYKQLYLDFNQLFKSISVSQTIEQVFINLFIENNTVKKEYAKTWQETKIKNFYQPLCYMIEHSQSNLLYIKYQDNYNYKGVKLILEALLKLKHSKYFTFENQVINQISSRMQHDEQLKQLFFQVYEKGYLVKSNYNLNMAIQF